MDKRTFLALSGYQWVSLLIALFFTLLFAPYESHDFYWDEAVYADLARSPLYSEMYSIGEGLFVRHPPLYPVILSILLRVIPVVPEVTFRLLSLLSFAGVLLLAFAFLRLSGKEGWGVLVQGALAMNCLFQQYAVSATMYAPLGFAIMLFFYGYRQRNKAFEVVGLCGAVLLHYFGWLIAVLVFFWARVTEGRWRRSDLLPLMIMVIWSFLAFDGLLMQATKLDVERYGGSSLKIIFSTYGVGIAVWLFGFLRTFREADLSQLSPEQKSFGLMSLIFLIFLILTALGKPFIRYQVIWIPLFYLILAISISEFRLFGGGWKVRVLFVLLLLIPNYRALGWFPHTQSFYDIYDSIYDQYWRQIIEKVGKSSVSVDNTKSYYYYYRERFPEAPTRQPPWDSLGIYRFRGMQNLAEDVEYIVCGQWDCPREGHHGSLQLGKIETYGSRTLLRVLREP